MKRLFWVQLHYSDQCIDVNKTIIDKPIIREWNKVHQYAVQDHLIIASETNPIGKDVYEGLKAKIYQGEDDPYMWNDGLNHYIAQGGFIYEDPKDNGELQILVDEAKRRIQLNIIEHYHTLVENLRHQLDKCIEKIRVK